MEIRRQEFQAEVPLSGGVVACMHDALGSSPCNCRKREEGKRRRKQRKRMEGREKGKIWIRKGITGFREYFVVVV